MLTLLPKVFKLICRFVVFSLHTLIIQIYVLQLRFDVKPFGNVSHGKKINLYFYQKNISMKTGEYHRDFYIQNRFSKVKNFFNFYIFS